MHAQLDEVSRDMFTVVLARVRGARAVAMADQQLSVEDGEQLALNGTVEIMCWCIIRGRLNNYEHRMNLTAFLQSTRDSF